MTWTPSSRFAGVATLLFAACPTVQLGLLGLMMLLDFNRGNGDRMSVGVSVPPLSVFFLPALALSSPWIIAGILLLRRSDAGRLLALFLTNLLCMKSRVFLAVYGARLPFSLARIIY